MRLFKFLLAKHAIKTIRERRFKIAELRELNDPFELRAYHELVTPVDKMAGLLREHLASQFGLMCFSRASDNPVLWTHYAEQHKGMCVEIELDDPNLTGVTYVTERIVSSKEPTAVNILSTKFDHWRYEDEVRLVTKLPKKRERGLFFADIDVRKVLKSVILGCRCHPHCERCVNLALLDEEYPAEVRVERTLLARDVFKVDREEIDRRKRARGLRVQQLAERDTGRQVNWYLGCDECRKSW